MKTRFDLAAPELAVAMRAAANETEAVRSGYEAMKLGADADMCQ